MPLFYNIGVPVGQDEQLVIMAWIAYTKAAGLGSLQNALWASVFYNNWREMADVTGGIGLAYALQTQGKVFHLDDQVLRLSVAGGAVVDPEALESCDEVNEAQQLYDLLDAQRTVLSGVDSKLYFVNDKDIGGWL